MSNLGFIRKLLFPPKCIFWRKVIDEGFVCEHCSKTLPVNNTKTATPQFVNAVYAPFYYKGVVRSAIIRYKFRRTSAYAKAFAKYIASTIKENDKFHADFITWVPISRWRLRTRGFDQSKLIAKALAKELDLPIIQTLKKTRNNRKQSMMKNVSARRANVIGVYEIIDAEKIFFKRALLIDDILTTGATVSEAARMLKTAGVLEISVAVIAKTKKRH